MKDKKTRRAEAKARQEEWAKLTTTQKLWVLARRPGLSAKQKAELEATLEKEKAK